jgi:serine/threonine protein kinase
MPDEAATQPDPEEPIRFGPYRVVERIAEGGMGLVLRGQDDRGGPRVAIKTVGSSRAADATAICREISTLSRLRHPGIVRLFGHGVANGMPWMAMELLEGRTLAEEMSLYWPETSRADGVRRLRSDELPTAPARGIRQRRRAPARPPHAVAGGGCLVDGITVLARLCLALDYLHANGFVHRDVKPANVFLGGRGRIILLDFGLACPAAAATGSELCVGTMEYAAPEQICASPVDCRADIYSLGCLLYELVTGRTPFLGDSTAEIADRQLKCDPIAPSHFIADVPSQLEGLVMSMLAKSPARRPGSAGEIGELLAAIAGRLPQRPGAFDGEGRERREQQLTGEETKEERRSGGKVGGRAGGTSGRGPRRLPARPVWGRRVAAGTP